MKTENQNRTVQVFVASSLDDFKNERLKLGELFDRVEQLLGVHIRWPRPETTPRIFSLEGSQSVFNQYIRESDFFFLVVGKHIGEYTLEEFHVALEQFRKTDKPIIRPYFLLRGGFPDESVYAFWRKLRNLRYYTDVMSSWEQIESDIQAFLMEWCVHHFSDSQAESQVGQVSGEKEPFPPEASKRTENSSGADGQDDDESWKQNGFLRCLKALQNGSLGGYPEIGRICYQGMEMAQKRANPKLSPCELEEALNEFQEALERSIARLKQDREDENTHEYNEQHRALMELQEALRNDPPPTAQGG